MRAILLGGGIALLLSLLGTRYAIRAMEQLGFGQPIRDDGPTSHHVKRGTPTMGGLVVIGATVLGYFSAKLITLTAPSASAYLLLYLMVGAGIVGFLDDFIKVRQQHSAGLPGRAKMLGLSIVALTFGILAVLPALKDDLGLTGDEATGVAIVRKALVEPLRWIAQNAGLEGYVAVQKVSDLKGGNGLNAATGEYVDLLKAGVVDPVKVTRSAVRNAASIAGMLLTTETLVVDKPEAPEPESHGHGHSHGPGGHTH